MEGMPTTSILTSPAEATAVKMERPATHAITLREGYSTPRTYRKTTIYAGLKAFSI